MLINTDSQEFKDLCKLRQSQKAYEEVGETVKSRKAFRILKTAIELATDGVIDLIDKANNRSDDEYAQEQIDTARTLGEGE